MIKRRLTGLLALLGIVAILIGMPALLIGLGANPIPDSIPTWGKVVSAMTSPDDGSLVLGLITIAAWVSWAVLTVSILVELGSRVRGVRAPSLPGLRMPQNAARTLVSAAFLLFGALPITAGAATAAPAHAATASTAAPAAVQVVDVTTSTGIPQPSDSGRVGPGGLVRVVRGDTLSQIALEQLGDDQRYPEIVKASAGITQPGGAHLGDPDVIDIGWTLRMPGKPKAAHHSAAQASATPRPSPHHSALPEAATPPLPAATPVAAPSTRHAPTPATGVPTQSGRLTTPAATSPAATSMPMPVAEDDSGWISRTAFGAGALLAAGLVGLLATRRRTQQRVRRPGQRLPMPVGDAARVEAQLRAAADPLSIQTVDVALRSLAQHHFTTGQPLPEVRAGRLTATQFDLYLEQPAQLPHPWSGTVDETVWALPVEATQELAALEVGGVPAPYPALVTIGQDQEGGHVLLDLEHLGSLGIVGPPEQTREVLAALALELATSIWADDLQVTIVGAFPELEDTMQTGRVRYLPSVGRILDTMATRAQADRAAMTAADAPNLNTARITGAAPDAWPPEIVLLAGDITDRQRTQLDELVETLPRVAMATVTAGTKIGQWAVEISPDDPDLATLAPIGMGLVPQRLPGEAYLHLLDVCADTDPEALEGIPAAEPTVAQIEAITPVDEPEDPERLPPANAPAATEPEPVAGPAQADQPAPTDTAGPAISAAIEPVHTYASRPATQGQQPDDKPAQPTDQGEQAVTPPTPNRPPAADESRAPRILMLGQVDMLNAAGKVEPTKRARLLEFAAFLALNPGATAVAIDDAIWPDRATEDNQNTRNPATSKLRRWLGTDPEGGEYLPRHQAGDSGYRLSAAVSTDVSEWRALVGADPLKAATEDLEAALKLVRGIPFEGTHRRRYTWADPIKQEMIWQIVDASFELGRRRLMEGRWRAAEAALAVGLRVEPAQEALWRLRILAAHEARNPAAENEAIERLLTVTEELECDLEPATEELLAALKSGAVFDQMIVNAAVL